MELELADELTSVGPARGDEMTFELALVDEVADLERVWLLDSLELA